MSSSPRVADKPAGSGAPHRNCPSCGANVQHIETRGPGDVRAQPCDCPIGHLTVRDFLGGVQ